MAKNTPIDRFAIARRYVQTMHRFVEQHPARTREELELLANAALMIAAQLAFSTGSKFTFARQAQLCWDRYDLAKKQLEAIGAGAVIHPNGSKRSGEPPYIPVCKGDAVVVWTDKLTYYEAFVIGFSAKYVRVKSDGTDIRTPSHGRIPRNFRMVKPAQLGLRPDLVDTLEQKGTLDDADSCRKALDDFNKTFFSKAERGLAE